MAAPVVRDVTPVGTMVNLGRSKLSYATEGSRLQRLEDCNALLGDRGALLNELETKGYLYIRGLHDRDEVLAARTKVIQHLDR